jgi:hypothetical protein
MPELPAVGRGSGVTGRRVPVPGAFVLASTAPGLVPGDDGDEVDSVLAVHLEIPVVRDDLLVCGTHKTNTTPGSGEDQHANNTDKTVLPGTRRHAC